MELSSGEALVAAASTGRGGIRFTTGMPHFVTCTRGIVRASQRQHASVTVTRSLPGHAARGTAQRSRCAAHALLRLERTPARTRTSAAAAARGVVRRGSLARLCCQRRARRGAACFAGGGFFGRVRGGCGRRQRRRRRRVEPRRCRVSSRRLSRARQPGHRAPAGWPMGRGARRPCCSRRAGRARRQAPRSAVAEQPCVPRCRSVASVIAEPALCLRV